MSKAILGWVPMNMTMHKNVGKLLQLASVQTLWATTFQMQQTLVCAAIKFMERTHCLAFGQDLPALATRTEMGCKIRASTN